MEIKPGTKFASIAAYYKAFPANTQKRLREIHKIIKAAAPDAEEVISYNMPAFKQAGMVAFYAGYKNHIGFYPTGSGIEAFQDEITCYKSSKGAVQFPLDEPLPADLITRMVQFKVEENTDKAKAKRKAPAKGRVKRA